MDETRTTALLSAANPDTDARGVSEVSFVEALAHPACVLLSGLVSPSACA
jgi:hypothetical protein